MAFFISHVISTRDSHISPRAKGPRADMGRGLICFFLKFNFILFKKNSKIQIVFPQKNNCEKLITRFHAKFPAAGLKNPYCTHPLPCNTAHIITPHM